MPTEHNPSPHDRAQAVLGALVDGGHVADDNVTDFDEAIEEMDWHNGSLVVATAWTDPEYKARLLADGTAACAELGFSGIEGEYIVVLEDVDDLKNLVVCTQCSCTAWPVLGLPPDWYKDPAYRSQVVRRPRRVLEEMGLDLSEDVKIRVWDTTAETRYVVLPQRPAGTEGWNTERLAEIVTRESMIGVQLVSIDR